MLSGPINRGAKMAAATQILGIKFLKNQRSSELYISQVLYSPSCNPYLTYCWSQQSNGNKKYSLSSSIDFQSLKTDNKLFFVQFLNKREHLLVFHFCCITLEYILLHIVGIVASGDVFTCSK